MSFFGVPDRVLELVLGFVDDPRDLRAVSQVSRQCCRIDGLTRTHVTIAMAYSTTPDRLFRRFPCLQSLKLKCKPRAAMFNIIPEDWGGYASPWIRGISDNFNFLKALHLRRMVVSDDDLHVLVRAKAHILVSLKLDYCSGFSTPSLVLIARSCKKLETLILEDCSISEEKNDEWLRVLATSNRILETLNFFLTNLRVSPQYLIHLLRNCPRLKTLKISECLMSDLIAFFSTTQVLQEFAATSFHNQNEAVDATQFENYHFPPSLHSLKLYFRVINSIQILLPYSAALKKLGLQFTSLNTEDHCQIVQRFPNLEVLEVMDVIGDRGLQVVAQTCKKLRRLRIESAGNDQDEDGKVTQVGLMAVAQGCPELEYMAVNVSDITNAALEAIGTHSKNLKDFRIVLLERVSATNFPLDFGVRGLLKGCTKLERFAFYGGHEALTDIGLYIIGEFSKNVRYMLLGNAGRSDEGLLALSRGCPSLQKLEIRTRCFSERAVAVAALQLKSLSYLWVQGFESSPTGSDLLAMKRPFWNIEFIAPNQNGPFLEGYAQVLAYYSFVGSRTDCPQYVTPLYP